ncbi:hypothetical protein SH1V18_23130 [Vallitalea longa]|uniref:Uncharacterized protein n=1 Tax=Vallitalea longa TaxID=2936439 RepID=A0A9W5YEP2_9FIRM|nr:hypothetical protein [Vallitalea longa]GKX29833.1 hypothetical protein SH1V18_23130 [Vallitalea longa]
MTNVIDKSPIKQYNWRVQDENYNFAIGRNDDNYIYDEMFENGIENKILRDDLVELKEVISTR